MHQHLEETLYTLPATFPSSHILLRAITRHFTCFFSQEDIACDDQVLASQLPEGRRREPLSRNESITGITPMTRYSCVTAVDPLGGTWPRS